MIEYQVRREGSEHTITVETIDPDGAAVSLELATDVAVTLSRKWGCVLTVHRVDDMAWHIQDYSVLVAAYDRGAAVPRVLMPLYGQERHLPYDSDDENQRIIRKFNDEETGS